MTKTICIELENKIISLSNGNLTMREVAKEVGVTDKVVKRIKEKHNLIFKESPFTALPIKTQEKIIDLFNNGYNTKDISTMLNLNQQRDYRVLKKNNIKVPKNMITITKVMEDNIIKSYKAGVSSVNLGKKYNMCDRTIIKILREHNVEIRKAGRESLVSNKDFFENIDTEEKAYFLGFIVADGSIGIYKNIKTFQIMLQSQDKYILEKLRTLLGYNIEKYDEKKDSIIVTQGNLKYSKSKDEYALSISCSKIYDDLYSHGIYPRKTFNTSIPSGIPDNLFRHFVRGLFDGDGCITNNTGYNTKRIVFYGQNSLLEPLQNKLKEDIPTLNNVKIFHKETLSMLTYGSKKDVEAFYHYMYDNATVFLTRKKNKFPIS